MEKEKIFNIRVNEKDIELFKKICKQLDTTASREVRRFIREFNSKHKQLDIFIGQ
jgi:hypothetical protein